jgi:hypothetical protein
MYRCHRIYYCQKIHIVERYFIVEDTLLSLLLRCGDVLVEWDSSFKSRCVWGFEVLDLRFQIRRMQKVKEVEEGIVELENGELESSKEGIRYAESSRAVWCSSLASARGQRRANNEGSVKSL